MPECHSSRLGEQQGYLFLPAWGSLALRGTNVFQQECFSQGAPVGGTHPVGVAQEADPFNARDTGCPLVEVVCCTREARFLWKLAGGKTKSAGLWRLYPFPQCSVPGEIRVLFMNVTKSWSFFPGRLCSCNGNCCHLPRAQMTHWQASTEVVTWLPLHQELRLGGKF